MTNFKKQILLVCGPDEPVSIWEPIKTLLDVDQSIINSFSIHIYSCNEEKNLLKLTEHFNYWYQSRKDQSINSSIILIGHGLGGIILLNFLVRKLQDGKSNELYNLMKIILFSTPHHGYVDINFQSKLLSFIKYKKTINYLKNWNNEILEINEMIKEYVINATELNNYYRPISFKAYFGKEDSLINPSSAQGYHSHFQELPGDYHSILSPSNNKDIRYQELLSSLLSAPSHKGIYTIESLKVFIKVQPFLKKTIELTTGEKTKIINTDNYGVISRTVKFSSQNICFNPYTLRYGIENGEGYIDANISGGKNIASEEKFSLYTAKRLEYFFEFIPKNGDEFTLDVSLYKAFDPGFRDVHFHLGNGKAWYDEIELTLDLDDFSQEGYSIFPLPILMLHPEDSHTCNMRFAERDDSHIVLISSCEGSKWSWKINDIGGGVIDLFWDIKINKNE